jgi:hypothetical protein
MQAPVPSEAEQEKAVHVCSSAESLRKHQKLDENHTDSHTFLLAKRCAAEEEQARPSWSRHR